MSLHGAAPNGGLAHGAFDLTYSESIADAVDALLDNPSLPRSWWLKARPRDADTSTDPPTLIDVDLSTDGHRLQPTDPGYDTGNPDGNELPEAIIAPYSVSVGLPGKPDLWGVAEMDVGLIVIGDADRSRRHLAGEDWVGRQSDVYVGPQGGRQVEFARVGQLLSRQLSFNAYSLSLHTDDYGFLFDRKIQEHSYLGRESVTGSDLTFTAATDKIASVTTDLSVFAAYTYIKVSSGANAGLLKIASATTNEIQVDATVTGLIDEAAGTPNTIEGALQGGDELKDRPIPILLGTERQIEPALVDGLENIYHIHDGLHHRPMQAVVAAEDGKGALGFDADYADITLAAPAPGEYATCLASGHIKLGETPQAVLTVRARGMVSATYGYVEDVAGLVKVLAVDFAGLSDPGELNGVALAELAAHTAVMGHWTGVDAESIRSVMQRFAQSAGAWVWLRPNKVMTAGQIGDPDTAAADVDLDASVGDLRESPWDVLPYEIPVGLVRVGYQPYSRTLSDTEVLGSVAEEARKDAGKEYRFVKAEITAAERVQNPEADEIEILTQLDSKAAAQELADAQLALRKTPRWLGTFSARSGLIKRGVGTVINLTDARLPTSPKKFVILAADNRGEQSGAADEIVWRCFG